MDVVGFEADGDGVLGWGVYGGGGGELFVERDFDMMISILTLTRLRSVEWGR